MPTVAQCSGGGKQGAGGKQSGDSTTTNTQQASNSPNGSGQGTFTGLTFDFDTVTAPPNELSTHPEKFAVMCYTLESADNTVQPFYLQPAQAIKLGSTDNICSIINQNNPLRMGQQLVIAIDATNLPQEQLDQLNILNINVSFLQGSPIASAPLAPSVTQGTMSLKAEIIPASKIYFLAWPVALSGDAKPTVSINSIFTPPPPGEERTVNTIYPPGSVVILNKDKTSGSPYYFNTVAGGISGEDNPLNFQTPDDGLVVDKEVIWTDYGTTPPVGQKIVDRAGSHVAGDTYYNSTNKHFYVALTSGKAGANDPTFKIAIKPTVPDGSVTWSYSGTAPPASIASSSATDQQINLMTQDLPQVHNLYNYFLTAGVAASTLKNRSYGFSSSNAPVETSNNPLVDPVLFLTFFPVALDDESPWKWTDIFRWPGISLGLSLSSPASNFYLGATTEVARNVLLTIGGNFAKITGLSPVPGTGSTPATVQNFRAGGFVSLSFNFTGFVQSLFSPSSGK